MIEGSQMTVSYDSLFHCADLLVQSAVAIAVIPAALKVSRVMKYFPPHRHTNGNIEYSPDFEPGKMETLKVKP